MKKRTVALSLVLVGPPLIAGCSSNSDGCDPNVEDCNRRGGYYGGGYYRGGARVAPGGTNSSARDSGGFGSTGRSFFRGS